MTFPYGLFVYLVVGFLICAAAYKIFPFWEEEYEPNIPPVMILLFWPILTIIFLFGCIDALLRKILHRKKQQ